MNWSPECWKERKYNKDLQTFLHQKERLHFFDKFGIAISHVSSRIDNDYDGFVIPSSYFYYMIVSCMCPMRKRVPPTGTQRHSGVGHRRAVRTRLSYLFVIAVDGT